MRLIDADYVLDGIRYIVIDSNEMITSSVVRNAMMLLVDSAKTVDAVPVTHGHWETVPNDKNTDGYYKMRCSACGATLWSIEPEERYCCKCGAKMDEYADGERKE